MSPPPKFTYFTSPPSAPSKKDECLPKLGAIFVGGPHRPKKSVSMLLTVRWLLLLSTLLLVQGGVDQGVPVRGAENWQPDQEEEFRIMGALSGLQRKIVGATAQLSEIDAEAGASSRTKQVPLVQKNRSTTQWFTHHWAWSSSIECIAMQWVVHRDREMNPQYECFFLYRRFGSSSST